MYIHSYLGYKDEVHALSQYLYKEYVWEINYILLSERKLVDA